MLTWIMLVWKTIVDNLTCLGTRRTQTVYLADGDKIMVFVMNLYLTSVRNSYENDQGKDCSPPLPPSQLYYYPIFFVIFTFRFGVFLLLFHTRFIYSIFCYVTPLTPKNFTPFHQLTLALVNCFYYTHTQL